MFGITRGLVKEICALLDRGLCQGAGQIARGEMRVQQACNLAFGQSDRNDDPECVHEVLRRVGICLNDMRWSSDEMRGRALKRFAIAQLGTRGNLNGSQVDKLSRKLSEMVSRRDMEAWNYAPTSEDQVRLDHVKAEAAEEFVQMLIEMKTPGSEYLDLIDEDENEKSI